MFIENTDSLKKSKQVYKPGSVSVLRQISIIYLLLTSLSGFSSLPPGIRRAALICFLICIKKQSPGIFGLSTHKVYPAKLSPVLPVGSYPAFSPLPRIKRGGNFLWHFLFFCCYSKRPSR
jgi:hypothetical protein